VMFIGCYGSILLYLEVYKVPLWTLVALRLDSSLNCVGLHWILGTRRIMNPQERVAAAAKLLVQSPPGEINDCLTGD